MTTAALPSADFIVGTWTFTDPVVPLDTPLYALCTGDQPGADVLSEGAAAVYYGAVEPGGSSLLLLHNDVDRSALSRQLIQQDGTVVEQGRWSSGGQGDSYIAFDPSGRFFVVANAHTGWSVFENGPDPRLLSSLTNWGSGPHPRQSKSHPHCAVFTPDGTWILATDMGADEVLAFPFDPETGHVGDKVRAFRAAPGSGPRHVVARGDRVYLLNELNNTLVVLRRDPGGMLSELQTVDTLPDDFTDFSHTAHLELSADGRHLYVSNRGHDSIMACDVLESGLVDRRRWFPCGGRWPWFFALRGDRMLVANTQSDNVTIFFVDSAGDLELAYEVNVPHPVYLSARPRPSAIGCLHHPAQGQES